MPNYLVYFEQEHGCDYTIGCGKSLDPINAQDMASAIARVKDVLREWHNELLESLDRITVFEITAEACIEAGTFREEIMEERREAKQKEDEEIERQEFIRLKKKFENEFS
jgi:hypothetical protein